MSCPSLGDSRGLRLDFPQNSSPLSQGCFMTSPGEKQADRKETGLAVGSGAFNKPIHSALINPLESSQGSPGESFHLLSKVVFQRRTG